MAKNLQLVKANYTEEYIERELRDIKHRLIARHFKLFTSFVSLETFMLVAHSQYVTVFNLRNDKNIYHHWFPEEVRGIFQARDSNADEDELVYVLLNNNAVHKFSMVENGQRAGDRAEAVVR